MADFSIRPITSDDASAAWEVAHRSLRTAGTAYGWEMPELDDDTRDRGRRRVEHVLEHDPDGGFIAERDGGIVGVALATRRGPLWFLSLLAVDTQVQSQGIGRALLESTLQTLGDAGGICASDDPKALRRYRRAGFRLMPCYEAKGPLDRALLPAITGVRTGSYSDDRSFIEEIAEKQRLAPHGPDLDFYAGLKRTLFVTDTAAGRGYVVCQGSGAALLAATTQAAASKLLWTAIAEASDTTIDIGWFAHDQPWAIDVVLDARLALRPSGSYCTSGAVGPMSPYIPNGAFG
ncbi:MAG: GNAT family N-acetyltransferase [Actinomycetota bacterium]